VLLSTGMATMAEVHEALAWAKSMRGSLDEISVLHCTSAYPAPDEALNLRAITTMREELKLPIGYSDHSTGIEAALAAVSLGATIVEKHLTLDCALPGPDHAASLEPESFAAMVRGIRRISRMLGDGVKAPRPQEQDAARVARRSIVAAVDIPAGATLGASMLACRRPATGIAPREWESVIGASARAAIPAGTVLQWEQLARRGD
jgi:N,N'-diacetyllegionaminate synthase